MNFELFEYMHACCLTCHEKTKNQRDMNVLKLVGSTVSIVSTAYLLMYFLLVFLICQTDI